MPDIRPLGTSGTNNAVFIQIPANTTTVVVPYPRKKFTRMFVSNLQGSTQIMADVSFLLRVNVGDKAFSNGSDYATSVQYRDKTDATTSNIVQLTSETENSFTLNVKSYSNIGAIYLY